MSTTSPAFRPDLAASPEPGSPPGPFREPGRRLSPDPARDRPWRVLVTLVAGVVVGLMILGAAAVSTWRWFDERSYPEVPAATELGLPDSLTLTSKVADVRVLESSEVDQVSVALVEDGATSLPEPGTEVRARITQHGEATDPVLAVSQPQYFRSFPGLPSERDLLVLVPLGHELSLDLTTEVGDLRAEGSFTALDVTTNVGNIQLAPVSAPEGLTVRSEVGEIDVELEDPAPARIKLASSVGDIDLHLPADAGGEVTARSDVGEVAVSAPGTDRWQVEATAQVGERHIDPSITGGTGEMVGTLTLSSEFGNVTVTR